MSDPRPPQISSQLARHIRNCLEMAGVSARPLLQRLDIPASVLAEIDGSIPLADFVRLLEWAAEESRNPHFGLHAARLMGSDGLGVMSFLFLSAPSLGQAFESFSAYLGTMQEATFNDFARGKDTSHFTYGIRDNRIAPRRQDSEYSIGVMHNLVQQYLGHRAAPVEVHFEHEQVGPLSRYEDYFGCPVFFEQPHNRLSLATALLDQGSAALSPDLYPIIASHMNSRMVAPPLRDAMTEQVRLHLLRCSPDDLPGLDALAARLNLSRATLARRLAAEGTSFGALVLERRMAFARHLLSTSHRSIADIALACGYAETASFTRAFGRHAGISPRQWRGQSQRA